MEKNASIILLGLLFTALWGNVYAQTQSLSTVAQRLQLTLESNQSTFNLAQQQNEYRNILQLSQSTSDYKLTASLLKQGDNYITITRQGDTETAPTELARVNLNANIVKREVEELSELVLTSTTVNQTGWTARGLSRGTNGYYISSGNNNYLRYTIPAGYDGGTIILYIYTYTAGYFKINGTAQSQTSANAWNTYYLTGLNSGSQITIQGCSRTGGNADSPNIYGVDVLWAPATLVPTVNVTPTLSLKNGNGWSTATSLGNTRAYQPNSFIDVDAMNVRITDAFTASTADNSHPMSYSYKADVPVNIDWTSADIAGDYYASIDFTKGDGSSLSTAERVGPDYWDSQLIYYYTPSDAGVHVLILDNTSDVIYTMPPTFAGHTVNVIVNSVSGSWGAGNVVVNGETKALTASSSQTWTVPVSANGTIRLQVASGDTYTCGITKVTIQNGNGTAQNAPQSEPAPSRGIVAGKEFNIQTKSMSVKK